MRRRRHQTPGGSLVFASCETPPWRRPFTAIAGKSASPLCQANGSAVVLALELVHCDFQADLTVAAVA